MTRQVSRLSVTLSQSTPYKLGEVVKGNVYLIPDEDSHIDSLGYRLKLEYINGKLSMGSKSVLKENIIVNKEVKKDQEYIFPFEFSNNSYATYTRDDVELALKLNAFVHFEKNEDSATSPRLGKTKPKKTWEYDHYIKFIPTKLQYSISTDSVELQMKQFYQNLLMIFIFLFFLYMISAGVEVLHFLQAPVIFLGIVIAVIAILSVLFINVVVGDLRVKFQNLNEEQFRVLIANSRKWKGISVFSVQYKIMEEIEISSGDSTSMKYSTIHASSAHTFNDPGGDIYADFEFPEIGIPSLRIPKFRIYWVLEMVFTAWMGIKYKFEEEFVVESQK